MKNEEAVRYEKHQRLPDQSNRRADTHSVSPGCRVELVSIDDPYTNLKPGERGTVRCVDSIGTVFADWDCGSGLNIAHGVDHIKIL